MEQLVGWTVIIVALVICVFMFIHTIVEIRKLDKKTLVLDIMQDGKSVGKLTLNTDRMKDDKSLVLEETFVNDNDFIHIDLTAAINRSSKI